MKLSKKWTTVTPLSKALALSMLVILPILGVFVGYKLRGAVMKSESTEKYETVQEIRAKPEVEIENGSNAICGDFTRSEIGVSADHFEIVTGPEWAPDCRHIAWSVFQSGTGFVTPPGESEPSMAPVPSVWPKEGIFLYDDRTKKTEKVFIPNGRSNIPTFVGWRDSSTIVFTQELDSGKKIFYYNLITKQTTSE